MQINSKFTHPGVVLMSYGLLSFFGPHKDHKGELYVSGKMSLYELEKELLLLMKVSFLNIFIMQSTALRGKMLFRNIQNIA